MVVATGGTLALELMLLRRWQAGVPPVVGIQCGLTHHTPLGRRMDITRQLLAASHTILFAEGELGAMREKFAVPAERITVNQFGVDLTYWTSGDEDDEGYILSVGNDNRRDYETLMAAAAMIPSRVVVVTERTIETPVPANVTLHRGSWKTGPISDSDLREMYRNSRCVVVPLVESDQPSGQSVTLQAMACGKPVVLTRPTGLWNREHMEACEGVHLVSPGDAADLAAAIARIVSDPAGCTRQGGICREFVEEHGDIRSFAKRLLDWCGVAMESEGRKL